MSHRYLVVVLIAYFLNESRFSIRATTKTFENYYAITKFAELSDFYEKLRPQNPQNVSGLSDYNKDQLCKRIFGSIVAINPAEDGYETQLKTSNYTIFEELFKAVEIPKSVLSRMTFSNKPVNKYKYVYDNSSKPRTFLVGGSEREENTFVCAVRKIDDKFWIDMYFVSDYGYNVNDSKDGETIIGRFVFFDNEIYGLAEELPRMVLPRYFQWTDYTTKRNRYKVAEKLENDPVCKLDSARKIRLCTYVCAQSENQCEDRVAVQEPCQRREFTWNNKSYDGWMLACKTSNRHPLHYNEPPTYEVKFYVAQTYFNNEAFVFGKDVAGEPQFWFKLKKVPVVVQEQIVD